MTTHTDSFVEASDTFLEDHDVLWKPSYGLADDLKVIGGAGYVVGDGPAAAGYYFYDASYSADHLAEAEIYHNSPTNNSHWGVAVRCNASSAASTDLDYYWLGSIYYSGAPEIRLRRVVNGVMTDLAWLAASSLGSTQQHFLRLEVSGTDPVVLTCKKSSDGNTWTAITEIGSGTGVYSDSHADRITTGKPGIFIPSGGDYNLRWLSWTGADLVESVTVTDAGDELFTNGETGITITGTAFKATQGTGKVYLSPTNNVSDAGRVEQTVTAWSNTSVTITAVKGSLSYLTTLYLFVVNSDSQSNATGYSVQLEPKVYIRETLVDLNANPVANETGLTVFVWRTLPASGNSTPAEVLTSKGTNGSGVTDWQIARGALTVNAPIWIMIFKDGSPFRATARKITPTYE